MWMILRQEVVSHSFYATFFCTFVSVAMEWGVFGAEEHCLYHMLMRNQIIVQGAGGDLLQNLLLE